MVSNPSPGSDISLPKLPRMAEQLVELWKEVSISPSVVSCPAATVQPLCIDNPFRVFLGFYLVSGNGRIGIEPNVSTANGMDFSSTGVPTREWFIERDKRLTTSAWFGNGQGAPMVVTVYEVVWRGKE